MINFCRFVPWWQLSCSKWQQYELFYVVPYSILSQKNWSYLIDILFGCKRNYCLPIHLDTTKENLKRIEQNATVCFAMHVYTTGVERNYNFINVFKIYFITRGIKRFWSYSLWSFSSMQYTYTKKTVLAIKKLGTSTYISISVTGSILYLFLSGCSEQKSVKFTWIQ